ncbi:MAG: hypothetical protein WC523_04770 [Patescibacteria group bacterium]
MVKNNALVEYNFEMALCHENYEDDDYYEISKSGKNIQDLIDYAAKELTKKNIDVTEIEGGIHLENVTIKTSLFGKYINTELEAYDFIESNKSSCVGTPFINEIKKSKYYKHKKELKNKKYIKQKENDIKQKEINSLLTDKESLIERLKSIDAEIQKLENT